MNNKDSLRTAVIGVGYLGKFHAEKYASLPQSTLIPVADADINNANQIAQQLGAAA